MSDTRADTTLSSLWFKALDSNPPTPPSWYGGTPLFDYGTNPNFAENLSQVPLSHRFSSPFTEVETKDSHFSRIQVTRDVRSEVGTRDWSDLKPNPPTELFSRLLIQRQSTGAYILDKKDLGFCVWHTVVHNAYGSDQTYPCQLLQLDVASGGKVLTKQDFKINVSPWRYSNNHGWMYPCLGGFSLHEVYGEELTEAQEYEKVAKRVVALYGDVNPLEQLPNILTQDKTYTITTDMTKQPDVTSLGSYWLNFCDTLYAYGGNVASLPKLVYATNGGWRQCLLFVGEFSIKQLHDYITDTDKFAISLNASSYPSGKDFSSEYATPYAFSGVAPISGELAYTARYNTKKYKAVGMRYMQQHDSEAYDRVSWLYSWQQTQLAKIDPVYSNKREALKLLDLVDSMSTVPVVKTSQRRVGDLAYEAGSFYTQVKDLKPPKMVVAGKADKSPPPTPTGIFSYEFFGTAKIDAFTFNGSVPTPYKPVYLLERDTGRMIRSAVSDKNGRYVLHGVPDGIDYIAVSIDPTKTYATTAEDFGVVTE